MKHHEIRSLSFRVSADCPSFPHECSVMALPPAWKQLLRQALAQAGNRPIDQVRLPIGVLNKAVRMLIPDISSITPSADLDKVQTWLYGYGDEPATTQALRLILRAWINTAFTEVLEQQRDQLADALADHELRWEKRTLDLAQWEIGDEGTAIIPKQQQELDGFILLPDLVATRLSSHEMTFSWGEQSIRFRRVPVYAREIELISWPPLEYTDDDGVIWPYSLVMTLTQQTIPFQSYPVLNCELGIRRWAGPRVSSFPRKEETSVYLADRVPWIDSLHHTRSFQVAPVAWERIPLAERQGQENGSKYRLAWNGGLIRLLDDLHVKPRDKFPTPEELRANPYAAIRAAIEKEGTPSAAIVFRNGIHPAHKVGTGLMPRDRYLFAEQIKQRIGQELIFIDPYRRKDVSFTVPSNVFFAKEPKSSSPSEEIYAQRRSVIAREVAGALSVEIWHQSDRVRQALLTALQHFLGCPLFHVNGERLVSETPELRIQVVARLLGAIGDRLSITSEKKERRQERIREALRQRVRAVESALPTSPQQVLAFIELDNEEAFQSDDDPKPALRKGFAIRLRLTQFITPYQEDPMWSKQRKHKEQTQLEHRADSAVRDLFRQLGLLAFPPTIILKTALEEIRMPDPLHYLGVWAIKQYRESSATHIAQVVPVFVHMDSSSTEVVALAPGFETWLSYPDALLALAQDQYLGYQQSEEVLRFVLTTLERYLPAFGDTLLCCHAQNLRGIWPWLTNEKITKRLHLPLSAYPRLRIVRERTGEHETAEWYAQGENTPYASSAGIFQIGESGHVFASIQDKPPAGKRSKDSSKVLSRVGKDKEKQPKTFPPDPTTPAWNAGIGEMTFSGAHSKEAPLYLGLTNQLRHGFASQYEYPTVLPFPLHLAKLMEQYVLPLPVIAQHRSREESQESV